MDIVRGFGSHVKHLLPHEREESKRKLGAIGNKSERDGCSIAELASLEDCLPFPEPLSHIANNLRTACRKNSNTNSRIPDIRPGCLMTNNDTWAEWSRVSVSIGLSTKNTNASGGTRVHVPQEECSNLFRNVSAQGINACAVQFVLAHLDRWSKKQNRTEWCGLRKARKMVRAS